ncbi:MAG: hypothetical protein AB8F74_23215 [Saprospiraceae bacterium]
MNAVVQFVTNTKVFKRIFGNALVSPGLYTKTHPKQFLLHQTAQGSFNRYDTIVRLLAVEEVYGLNDFGWNLYLKMQQTREEAFNKHIKELDVFKADFLRLINSVEKNGFDKKYPILTNAKGMLSDGSHRLACSLYFEVEEVVLKRDKNDHSDVNYGLNWFAQNGFSDLECTRLKQRFEQIQTEDRTDFMAIVWSPAVAHTDDILEDFKKQYLVKDVQKVTFENKYEYSAFVKGMYAIDDIADWKIDKKLSYMENYPAEAVVIIYEMDFPNYRKKAANGKPLSRNVEALKKEIREKYSKRITPYFHDIILHIGDNEEHTDHMNQILDKNIAVSEFLTSIKSYNYVLLKAEAPYQPSSFPETYPLGKDLDVLCAFDDYELIVAELNTFKSEYEKAYEVRTIEKENGLKVRFELSGFLCYQIDLSFEVFSIEQTKVKAFLNDRITKDNYYTLPLQKELIIRSFEYLSNEKKKHHLTFIKKNKSALDWSFMGQYLSPADTQTLKKKL